MQMKHLDGLLVRRQKHGGNFKAVSNTIKAESNTVSALIRLLALAEICCVEFQANYLFHFRTAFL